MVDHAEELDSMLARHDERVARAASCGIIKNFLADIIEADIGRLTGERVGKATLTEQEKTARDALMAVLQPIQTAAKRKFIGET